MSYENVKHYFDQIGMGQRVMNLRQSSATVEEPAEAIGCQPCQIAKTMSFLVNDKPILIVTAGDTKVDNKKFKEVFHQKAKMIPYEEVEKLIGHNVGGVCPFGINENVTVYLDNSLKKFDTIYPACGESNTAIKLTIEELEKTSNYKKWIDVCK